MNDLLDNISIFPTWLQELFLISLSLLMILKIFINIGLTLKSQKMKDACDGWVKTFTLVGAFLRHQIDDPIKYPRAEKFLKYTLIFICYVVAVIVFLEFLIFALLWASNSQSLTIFQQVGVISFCVLCAYIAAALKTQGNRELIKVRATNTY